MKGLIRALIYVAFGGLIFALFLILLFPYGILKKRLASEIEKNLGPTYHVAIGKMTPSFPLGVSLKRVALTQEVQGGAQDVAVFDRVSANLSLPSLIFGNLSVGFDVQVKKGRIQGEYERRKNSFGITLVLKEINLADLGFLSSNYGLKVESNIHGRVNLDFYPFEPLRNTGDILLELKQLGLLESTLKTMAGDVTLPALKIASPDGNSKIQVEVGRGAMEFKEFQLSGEDMSANMTGKVYFSQNVQNYRLSFRGSVKFQPEVEPKLPLLVIVASQKNEEGAYPFTVTGRVRALNARIGTFRIPL